MRFNRKSSEKRVARSERGFTLIEVMIAVIIVGMMAGVVVYATTGFLEKAKVKRAKADITTFVGGGRCVLHG